LLLVTDISGTMCTVHIEAKSRHLLQHVTSIHHLDLPPPNTAFCCHCFQWAIYITLTT